MCFGETADVAVRHQLEIFDGGRVVKGGEDEGFGGMSGSFSS